MEHLACDLSLTIKFAHIFCSPKNMHQYSVAISLESISNMKDANNISVQGMITTINNQLDCFQTITLTNNVAVTFLATKINTYIDSIQLR